MKKLVEELTKAMRALQSRIDQTAKNKYDTRIPIMKQNRFSLASFSYIDLQILNDKLIELERLFIFDEPSRHMSTADDASRYGSLRSLVIVLEGFPFLDMCCSDRLSV